MRRALRVLIPAALLSFVGLGVLAFTGELNLLRVDLTSLLQWGDATKQGETSVVSATPAAGSQRAPSAAPSSAAGTPRVQASPEVAALAPGRPDIGRSGLKIEFARIDAEGASVIGGRAPAGSRVSVHANGETVAVVTASEDGQWSVIVTRAFRPGGLDLKATSEVSDTAAALESSTVTVQVPKGSGVAELASVEQKARPILPPRAPEAESRAISEFAAMVERARSSNEQGGSAKPETGIVPVPITFVTGAATMTAEGARAAQLLAEYVRIMKPHTITLSGHADVRGGDDYNLDLSRRRLETIRSFLRETGYVGELALQAKGKSEPYQGIDRRTASVQEVYQADRRVELRLAE